MQINYHNPTNRPATVAVVKIMLRLVLAFLCLSTIPLKAADHPSNTVILVAIDGVRWQEVFKGLDPSLASRVFQKNFPDRKAIMPFLWGQLAREGHVYGNRDEGSQVDLQNPYHFSYPGYNEMLTGNVDPKINRNANIYNPNITILERVNAMPKHKGRVAAFTTWSTFPYIINDKRSGVPVHVGGTDKATFGLALKAVKSKKMDMIFIAFDEADTAAHNGSYSDYIQAIHGADQMVASLWKTLQSDPRYRGKVSLFLTTDHGRGGVWGNSDFNDFSQHGGKVSGDEHVWIAEMGSVGNNKPHSFSDLVMKMEKLLN